MWSLITACLPGSEISLGVLVEITVEACYCSGRGSGRKGAEVDGGQTTVLGNGVPTGGSAHFRFAPFFGRDYIRIPRLSGGNSAKKKDCAHRTALHHTVGLCFSSDAAGT